MFDCTITVSDAAAYSGIPSGNGLLGLTRGWSSHRLARQII